MKMVRHVLFEVKMFFRVVGEVLTYLWRGYWRIHHSLIIADCLETEEGREKLVQAMVEPIRKSVYSGR